MLSETKLKILEACKNPCSFTQIVKAAGITKRNVATHINQLEEMGLILKGGNGKYLLTEKGTVELEREVGGRLESMELMASSWIDSSRNLYEEAEKRLYLHGSALDLRPPRSFIDALLGLTWKDLLESFLVLGEKDKEYLGFLSNLYIESVKSFLGTSKQTMSFQEIRAAWQLARDVVDNREGLHFDFKSSWNTLHYELSEELKETMRKRNLTPEHIYKKLKAFSFPVLERIRMVRKGVL